MPLPKALVTRTLLPDALDIIRAVADVAGLARRDPTISI